MSVTLAPRARIRVNASWPGVSMNTILRPFFSMWYAPMCWVMPPASRVGHIGGADGVQQRCFAVIDVAHDGDHRRAPHAIGGLFGQLDFLRALFFVADLVGGSAELARHVLGHLHIQLLVDGGEDFLLHQLLDHQVGFDAELFGKLLDGDAFGDRDLAIDGRRRGGLLAPRHRHPQPTLFLFLIAMAIAPAGLGLMAALLLGGGQRRGRLDAQRRSGMQRSGDGADLRATARPLGRGRRDRA